VTSLGSMKTSLAMNIAPDPKPANGCTTSIPESTCNRNIPKPAQNAPTFNQTMGPVIGPVANKPTGIQPQPSLTSRSTGSNKPGEIADDQMKPVQRSGHPQLCNPFPSREEYQLAN